MPDLWMDVDTAVIVPVNVMPLIDDTDFKSIETAVAYNAAGLALTWHFFTTAGTEASVAVTPTDGTGVYDWAEDVADKGTYTIEIPASGGASANNDTEGFGWFTGVATGVLPWRGPTIGFRAAALNNSLVDGATVDVNVTAMAAGTVTAAAIATGAIDADAIADGAIDAGALAADAITAAKVAADVGAEIADAVWDEAQAGHVAAGSFGEVATEVAAILVDTGTTLQAELDGIQADTEDIQTQIGVAGAGLTAINLPDQTMNITGNITGNLSGSVGSVTGAVGSVTGNVGGNVAGSVASVTAEVSADVKKINGTTVNGDGGATPWGP